MEGIIYLGLATFLGLGLLAYAVRTLEGGSPELRGVNKSIWCEGMQRVVDVDFMQVNPNMYDIASCSAFSVDDCVSCDKRCLKAIREISEPTGEAEEEPQPARAWA
jgi:hypothetical protein